MKMKKGFTPKNSFWNFKGFTPKNSFWNFKGFTPKNSFWNFKGFTPKNSFWNFKGFTLLELLITIIILGILAAIAIPNYTNAVEQRRGEACINNMRAILAAWHVYNIKNTTSYDPDGTFRAVPTINDAFKIAISENNFGNSELTDYGFIMDFTPGTPSYEITAYRQSGTYSGYIIECEYTPNGVTVGGITYYYRWFENWPWMPEDE